MKLSNQSRLFFTVIIFISFFMFEPAYGAWSYDWDTRTDRDGKPAGIYTTTPFPIDENSTSYSITNDEGTKTYSLGSLYFVDKDCSNGITTYDPAADSCTGGNELSYSSISRALSAVSSGNKTIIVRGGTYNEYGLSVKSGTDDTHRYMVVGYGQERPVIEGTFSSTGSDVIDLSRYSTIQRLKIQNHYNMGSRAQRTRSNIIDTWYYNTNTGTGDGNIYAAGSDGLFIYHSVSEHVCGHAIKISDGAANSLIEWSIVKEFGYWPGLTTACRGSNHPSGFDYPDTGPNHINRYNIAGTGLFYAVQFRGDTGSYGPRGSGFVSFHHNEIYDTTHFDDVTGEAGHVSPNQVLFNRSYSGTFDIYSNIIRDSADGGSYGLYITRDQNGATMNIYNNILHGNNGEEIYISDNTSTINMWNNSLYDNDDNDALLNNGTGADLDMKNNVFYQAGRSSAVSMGSGTHSYNNYYAPNGSIGVTLGTGETIGDPLWSNIPSSGTIRYANFYLLEDLPGVDLSLNFTEDLGGQYRLNWNMGALDYLYNGTDDFLPPAPPLGLNITPQ